LNANPSRLAPKGKEVVGEKIPEENNDHRHQLAGIKEPSPITIEQVQK